MFSTSYNELVEYFWIGIEIRIPILHEFNPLEKLKIEKCELRYENGLSKRNKEFF